MSKPDIQQQIAAQFSKAAESYDLAAEVQWQSGIDIIKRFAANSFDSGLDIGCATGKLSQTLPCKNIDLIDISQPMLAKAISRLPHAKGHLANFETWQSNHNYNLVFSHFAFQWFEQLEMAIINARQICTQQLSISFPIQPSLSEIDNAAQSSGLDVLLKYPLPSLEAVSQIAKNQSLTLEILQYQTENISLLSHLQSIKKMGATANHAAFISNDLIKVRQLLKTTKVQASWHIAHLTWQI